MEALRLTIDVPRRAFRVAVDLAVGRETVALVGPSGAGKTTVLRAISGLVRPDRGRIELDGAVLFDGEAGIDVPPERRRVGFVFQDYALFPHMTVEQNVRYAGRERVEDLLERLEIAHLARARPESLSGGERQRVGLARALARDPAVLLLDEPLSALDAHTRVTVRAELRELLEGFDLPTLLVTHDYEDAAALAGRIGVLVEGRLLQIGTPAELIAAPADPFVASFTGGNLLRGEATLGAGGLTIVRLEDGTALASADESRLRTRARCRLRAVPASALRPGVASPRRRLPPVKLATKGSAGAAMSSAGVPTWSSLPSTSTPIRPASAAASS